MSYKLNELDEEILKIRVQLEKESNKELKKILSEQKKYLEQMREFVGSLYMEYGEDLKMTFSEQYNVKRELKSELIEVREGLTAFEVAIVARILLQGYINGYYKTANTIDKGLSANISISYKLLRPEFVQAVINANFEGQSFSNRIWKNKRWLVDKLYNTIGKGITKGHNINKMAREIKNIFGSSAYQSRRLINTELARIVTEAQDEIYRDSGVVDEVMWTATLDEKVCSDCAELDGKIFDLHDDNKPMPPIHSSDRCAYVPIVDNWNPTKRRDNITKENIAYTDYKSWLKDNNVR